MKLAQIQFASWDKVYNFSLNGLDLALGDLVIVNTDLGMELGEVVHFIDLPVEKADEAGCSCPNKTACPHKAVKPVLRKASQADLERTADLETKDKALDYCKKLAKQYDLPIKLIDAHFSFDGSRITFAFIADGRVDFRELAKDLTRHFNRTVRLQQIGIRDEARIMGDYGRCGRPLCCARFLNDLASITSEMAEAQQCAHRGSDRLSGICGRLMCCLSYEVEGYTDLVKNMPPIGAKVNVDGRRGMIVGHHILKQSVDVEFPGEKENERSVTIEVDLNRHKNKNGGK